MLELASQIDAAAEIVRARWSEVPKAGIILGSGLGDFADEIEVQASIDYSEIPNFPNVSAMGHRGRLVCGMLEGKPVVAYQGRFHLYEGHSAQAASMPVRLLKALGADTLIVSNAAGGCNPYFAVGDVMLIEDQINFMFDNPLIGINDDNLGPRFPDMSTPYDEELQSLARQIAREENFLLHRGVYFAMLGPTYETRAEYRMVHTLGGDAVGMSTVPEVVAAIHAGMKVLGFSTITNVATTDATTGTSGHDVLVAAASAADKLSKLVRGVVRTL